MSVIIPLYNKGGYVARALDSVFAQTFQDFELIVVNDGSSDNGPAIVHNYDDRRIRLINQENRGVSAARNRGIDEARGKLVAFLDADDEWLPEFLETIMDLKRRFPQGGAYGTSSYHSLGGTLSEYIDRRGKWEGEVPCYLTRKRRRIHSSCAAIKKSVFARVGLFRPGLTMGEDLDMWLRVATYFPIVYSSRRLSIYHLDAVGRVSSKGRNDCPNPLSISLKSILNDPQVSEKQKKRAVTYVAEYEEDKAWELLCRGRRREALYVLLASARVYGVTFRWFSRMLHVLVPGSIRCRAILRSLVTWTHSS